MKKLLELSGPIYLGAALSFFGGIILLNWEFYAIIVPFFVIAKISGFNRRK